MGQAKHQQMEQEDKYQVAQQVAVQAGILSECEMHDIIYDGGTDSYEDAYKLANTLISQDDPLVVIFNGNRRELTDLLKDIKSEFGENCPLCDKYMED